MKSAFLGTFLAVAIAPFAHAQEQLLPPPSLEGTPDGQGIYTFCYETTDSTEENPIFMTGGAYLPMTLPDDDTQRIIDGVRGSFESVGHNYSSADIFSRNQEAGEMLRNQFHTIERYFGPVKGGIMQYQVDFCPDTASEALDSGEWFDPNMQDPEAL